MTVNLLRYKEDLLQTYNSILSSENPDDWALFAYEGTSNTLKPEITGHDGIDGLRENLNSGKLMYGLIKIKDPSSSSWKLMLIHWQGDGVQSIRLAPFASHIHEVKKFFKGVHLTHYARSEDDVDADSIARSFSKVNTSARNVVLDDVSKQPLNAKSVYEKADLSKDINASERDQFWSREEKEETKRREMERQRIAAENKRLSEEQQRLREKITESNHESDSRRHNVVTSELMRRERLQEVSEVIKPKVDLKCMWEQKTSAPANDSKLVPSKPPAKKLTSPAKVFNRTNGIKEKELKNICEAVTTTRIEEPAKTTDIVANGTSKDDKEEPQKCEKIPVQDKDSSPEKDWETINMEDVEHANDSSVPAGESTEKPTAKPELAIQAQALWDYQAADDTEISLNPGDIVVHIEQIDEGWWRGQAPDGTVGLFPANYVEVLE